MTMPRKPQLNEESTLDLVEFNSENTPDFIKHERNTIKISNNGKFTITTAAAEIIGISEKKKVAFFQDKNEQENWYVAIVDAGGFEVEKSVRENVGKQKTTVILYTIKNQNLAFKISEAIDIKLPLTFKVGKNSTGKYFPLLYEKKEG